MSSLLDLIPAAKEREKLLKRAKREKRKTAAAQTQSSINERFRKRRYIGTLKESKKSSH
jgi:hypothetical protein